MSWEAEQDRITREGRLYFAAPEVVLAELKSLSRRSRLEVVRSFTEALEPKLIERNDPLINIALACYCTNKDVFTALYKHSKEPPSDNRDGIYKRNLRLGCLSNQTIAAHILFDFPGRLVGEQEVLWILSEAELPELEALVSNPAVSEKLLEEIFSMTGFMPRLSDERRQMAVSFAAKNERINIKKEYYDSPDMGHYGIHEAIFRFFEIVPVEPRWFWIVYDLLGRLQPSQVHHPERIDHVLTRWKGFKLGGSKKGEEMEGNFTDLSLTEEQRCNFAALYGRGFANGQSVDFGSPNAKDVALRCAYYGSGSITEKEMKAAYKRDKSVYLFAVASNSNIITNGKLRKLYEEQSGRDLSKQYRKHLAALEKQIDEQVSHKSAQGADSEDTNVERLERIEAAAVALQSKVTEWSSQFETFKKYAIAIAIVLAIAYWLKT